MRYYDFSRNMVLVDKTSKDNDAYVRLVHSATKSFDVDLYVNDKLMVPDLRYREFTDYIKLPPGTYNLKAYPKNTKTPLLLDSTVQIDPKTVTTLAIYSQIRKLFLYPVKESSLSMPTKGKAKVKIANLIENIPPVDIYLSDGKLLYKNVAFKDLTNYIELPANTYTINIKLADSDISILYVPNIFLNTDNYYTLYLIGLINDYHDPQMLIPLDGITYLNL